MQALRNPLLLSLRGYATRFRISPQGSRWIHMPRVADPSYASIARRLASSPDLQVFYIRKMQEEAKARGECVDSMEGGLSAKDYDVLITDVSHTTLETTISGISYLSPAKSADADAVITVGEGYIHGRSYRLIIPFVVARFDVTRWVFFIVDTGSLWTYLSEQACSVFGITERSNVTIGGYNHAVDTPHDNAHFKDINILGGDYLSLNRVDLLVNYPKRRVKLLFGGDWTFSRGDAG